MANITRLDPTKRVERLINFSRCIRESPASENALKKLDMSIAPDLISLEGRKLQRPKIKTERTNETIEGNFYNQVGNGLLCSRVLEHWYVISTEKYARKTNNFVQQVQNKMRSSNLQIPYPTFVTTRNDSKEQLLEEIENVIRRDPQLIMIVVPNDQADRYQAIKKKCCIERAIPTQVINASKTFDNPKNNLNSIAKKVALQMSCKIGGAPWGIHVPLNNTLIIGYDVSHDKVNNMTFGALVATLDQYQSTFYSVVSQHGNNEQLSQTFTLNVVKAVKQFQEKNGVLPRCIFIYRDGVGDGQIRHVLDHEQKPLEQALEKGFGGLQVTFIIVNKKTNTRLFASNYYEGHKNPEAGTVVDTVITLPERYDFFLVPTSLRQGTVSPTYYNVIYDTCQLPAAKLQQLTYSLCFGYYNWTDAIAVPAVCKYAARLALLCSKHLHRPPRVELGDRLYFL